MNYNKINENRLNFSLLYWLLVFGTTFVIFNICNYSKTERKKTPIHTNSYRKQCNFIDLF